MNIMKEIGKRFKQLRVEQNLKQKDIAEILGIKRDAYGKIEQGVNNATVPHLLTLYSRFGISLNWLLLGTGPMYTGNKQEQVIELGDYSEDVNELLTDMRDYKAVLHSVLSYYYEKRRKLKSIDDNGDHDHDHDQDQDIEAIYE